MPKTSYRRDIIIEEHGMKPSDIKRTKDSRWKRLIKEFDDVCKEAEQPGEHMRMKRVIQFPDSPYLDSVSICLWCGTWFRGAPFKGYTTTLTGIQQALRRKFNDDDI